MPKITRKSLIAALQKIQGMDLKEKEAICDEIHHEQPNLLDSVLVLTRMGVSLAYVDIVLEILMVIHLAIKESGKKLKTITIKEQRRELKRIMDYMNLSAGKKPEVFAKLMERYIGYRKEPFLLAYVVVQLKEKGVPYDTREESKHVILTAVHLVGCIANAKKLV